MAIQCPPAPETDSKSTFLTSAVLGYSFSIVSHEFATFQHFQKKRKFSVRRCFPIQKIPHNDYFTTIRVLQHQKPTQNAQFWLPMHLGNHFPSFPTILRLLFFSTKFRFFSVRRSSSTSTKTGAYNHTASTAFGKLGPLETRKLLDKFS